MRESRLTARASAFLSNAPVGHRHMSLPSRNAPCPCGSGRRYKRCHGALGSPDPFLGVSDEVIAIHRDERTGQTRTYREDFVIRQIRDAHPQQARAFDGRFGQDILDISRELAIASSLVEVGVENAERAGDREVRERLGGILHNAISTTIAALEIARCGYTLQPGMLLRSVLEAIAVVMDVLVNEESAMRFRARKYSPDGAAGRANKVLRLVGRFYGVLSNYHTHVTEAHEANYPLDSTGESAAGALRVLKAAAALVGLTVELLFHGSAVQTRFWKRHRTGGLTFSPDEGDLRFLLEFPRLSSDPDAEQQVVQLQWGPQFERPKP